ncbi:MAG: D-glycero-beta-D-manno-heptose-7-phosphate kinase [Gammaproteobacteria bacterium]|nr:D-glycero-beta-D-manno-heptose-7-phosphate kinase [Gammaproteobacteria bacterium]|tara:strand:+ start:150975 stop:151901 length:927 start_codon:yes stop_codon:yes gene_type:complete
MKNKNKILVIGDIMLDRYWKGSIDRISPEAPVPIINVSSSVDKLGGAANVAKNLSDLGIKPTLVGIVGDDEASNKITTLLKKNKITFKKIVDPKVRTTIKLRVLGKNQQLMRIDHEDRNKSKTKKELLRTIKENILDHEAIIISDYDKGVVKPIIKELIKLAERSKTKVFIDPKGDDFNYYINSYLVKPNQKEFENIVGSPKNFQDFESRAKKLREKLKLKALLITRGKDGMLLVEENNITKFKAHQQDVFDVTGAGDTVISVLAAEIIKGKTINNAVKISNIAAGITIQKLGTASVTNKDLKNAIKK